METTNYAFVYGTLRQGEYNNVMMNGAELVDAAATTHGRLYFAHRGFDSYPKAILNAALPEIVTGDVWEISGLLGKAWDAVSRMEFGAGYFMSWIDVTLSDGRVVRAAAFVVADSRGLGARIESGDWTKRPAPGPAPDYWDEEPGEDDDEEEPCECGGGEYTNQPHAPTCPYFTDCRDCGRPYEQCACGLDADRVRIEILDDVTEADLVDDPHEADCLCDDCWASGRRPPR